MFSASSPSPEEGKLFWAATVTCRCAAPDDERQNRRYTVEENTERDDRDDDHHHDTPFFETTTTTSERRVEMTRRGRTRCRARGIASSSSNGLERADEQQRKRRFERRQSVRTILRGRRGPTMKETKRRKTDEDDDAEKEEAKQEGKKRNGTNTGTNTLSSSSLEKLLIPGTIPGPPDSRGNVGMTGSKSSFWPKRRYRTIRFERARSMQSFP